jgi:hypothetical protein
MRTKLFGAFIAALAITAFAALPSAAMAENVLLKEGSTNVTVNSTLRATSRNAIFTGRQSGLSVACDKTSIRGKVRTNPGARVTPRNEGLFQNSNGGDKCKVEPTAGRVRARVENLTFREDITLTKENSIVSGRTTVRFTFRFFDRGLSESPIAACNYEGTIEVTGTAGSGAFIIQSEADAELEPGSVGQCDERVFFTGDFGLTRRDGTTVVKPN